MATNKRSTGFAIAVVAVYVFARHLIYHVMPAASFDAWFFRDLVMSAPRLTALLACLIYSRRSGGWTEWGWTFSLTRTGAIALALVTGMELLLHFAHGSGSDLPPWVILFGWLATGPVALFEEAAFRSLMFLSMRRQLSPRLAALLCSTLFMVYHVEAQPVEHWPHIFVFGLGTCAAIQCGAGLGWLIAAHWLVDGAWFHLTTGPGSSWAWDGYTVFLIITSAASLALLRESPATRPPNDAASEFQG